MRAEKVTLFKLMVNDEEMGALRAALHIAADNAIASDQRATMEQLADELEAVSE